MIPLSKSYLCSEHFTEDCFDIEDLVVRLKPDSVPVRLASKDTQQSDGKNENPAARSELDARQHEADDRQEGNQATSTAEATSVPKTNPPYRARLKAKKSTKKGKQQGNQEARIFKLVPMDTMDPAMRSAVEAEYVKPSGKQGRNKGTGSHFPVPVMIMDPAKRSVTGEGNGKDGNRKEGKQATGSPRQVPVLIMDPAMRSTLEARYKQRSKQGGNQPVVTFWPVSSPFVGDVQEETSADRNFQPILAHELDHPYTTRVSLQEKLLATTRRLEVCKKQLSRERQRADRLKKRLNRIRSFYASIHNEKVVIKKSKHALKKKKGKHKKKTEPPPSDIEMLEVSLSDFPVIDLPEETTSLLSQLFKVSSDDTFMSELENAE